MQDAKTLRVPASSGNIGSGFDAAGISLKIFNEITFTPSSELMFVGDEEQKCGGAKPEKNMLWRAYEKTCRMFKYPVTPLCISQHSDIPAARGLGSSAACAAGGAAMAVLLNTGTMDKDKIYKAAARFEGHPDNAAAAVYGGAVICAGKKVRKIEIGEELSAVLLIPGFKLKTQKARSVLPKQVSIRDASANIAAFGLLVQSLMSHDYSLLPQALEDRLQMPYRKELIPHYDAICKAAIKRGALGVCLSGAGPSVICYVSGNSDVFVQEMSRYLKGLPEDWDVCESGFDNDGIRLI